MDVRELAYRFILTTYNNAHDSTTKIIVHLEIASTSWLSFELCAILIIRNGPYVLRHLSHVSSENFICSHWESVDRVLASYRMSRRLYPPRCQIRIAEKWMREYRLIRCHYGIQSWPSQEPQIELRKYFMLGAPWKWGCLRVADNRRSTE